MSSKHENGTTVISNEELMDATLHNREMFNRFFREEWRPYVDQTQTSIKNLDQLPGIADSLKLMTRGILVLLAILVLINGAGQIIQQVKDANTTFKGRIGGPNGAEIEVSKVEERQPK